MPLIELWSSNPTVIGQFAIEQIVAAAGSGDLKDNSACSEELRKYLTEIPSQKLADYVEGCLSNHFSKGGMVLQDLVNELGRRLDYTVTNGRYQGTINAVGYDGIWNSPEAHTIVAEVKTTDAYRISLDTLAGYRQKLVNNGQVARESSILIVVGRQDTGELEAQVRGSRHAWDMRLISADALIKLVQLKENAEGPETGRKIRSLLVPREYTRLDEMIDVMFTTAKDVESVAAATPVEEQTAAEGNDIPEKTRGAWEFTDSATLQAKRDEIIAALARREGIPLIKKSRALYWSPDHAKRAVFTISKHYDRRIGPRYWYAYHTQWNEFLSAGDGYFVLGCMDRNHAFAIPAEDFRPLMEYLNTTENADGTCYWHIQLAEAASAEVSLILPKQKTNVPLSKYGLNLG